MKRIIVIVIAVLSLCYCSKEDSQNSSDDKPKGKFIVFKDAVTKARLLEVYDLNNDAELSYSEAAAATSLILSAFPSKGEVSVGSIKYLDELQYFTGITAVKLVTSKQGASMFIALQGISIPKNVTYIQSFGPSYGSFDDISSEVKYLEYVKCYPTTPPSNVHYLLLSKNNTSILYVPKNSIEQYKERIRTELTSLKIDAQTIEKTLVRVKVF